MLKINLNKIMTYLYRADAGDGVYIWEWGVNKS